MHKLTGIDDYFILCMAFSEKLWLWTLQGPVSSPISLQHYKDAFLPAEH